MPPLVGVAIYLGELQGTVACFSNRGRQLYTQVWRELVGIDMVPARALGQI